jgi:hypothetical protein
MSRWAAAEMARHDWRMLIEAGVSLARFDATAWVREIDVPTAVLVTAQDRAIGAMPQLRTALAVRGATIHRIDDGHVACANPSFAAPLLGACSDVADRIALSAMERRAS